MKRLLTVCLVLALFGIAAVGFLQITKQQADTEIIEAPSISFGGDTALIIEKEFESIEAMHLAFETDGVPEGGYVLINTGSVEDPDNAKIFVKRADGYKLVTDMSCEVIYVEKVKIHRLPAFYMLWSSFGNVGFRGICV